MSSQKSEVPVHTNGHATAPHTATQSSNGVHNLAKPHLGKISEAERSFDVDPFASPAVYYGESHAPRWPKKSRTLSAIEQRGEKSTHESYKAPARRTSHDAQGNAPRRYLIDVAETLKLLLSREDTDNNVQITIEDSGPKTLPLGTAASGGYRNFDIRGTYMLSNLLQELTLAKQYGRKHVVLDEARLNENPVNRLSRLIRDSFWPNLTRRIDGSNIAKVGKDPKDWTADPRPRIYIPVGAPEQFEYYTRIAQEHPNMRLDVRWLQEKCDDNEYVRDLNEAPGLLAVAMERIANTPDGKPDFRGLPFVVPGGRFNELYGWDSYMETLGLLVNDKVDLCEGMVKHFCFCIRHYGKILNANRTYYLCRSQPPFLTDMALRVYDRIKHEPHALEFLREAILAAMKDYHNTWMSPPRFDPDSGLSRYVPGGMGVPPETEASHFVHVLQPYADKHKMSFKEFVKAYNYGHVFEPELDEYFLHDRAVRESGHDTSYRLEKVAANLATVDLNSCLYKMESDIARCIRLYFDDRLEVPAEWRTKGQPAGHFETSSYWDRQSRKRRQQMDKLMWSEEEGMFFDYNTKLKKQTGYESATTFWAMWAGAATPRQAQIMVEKALPKFEVHGGLVSGTEKSRGPVGLSRPNRQWDYPFGWAPQQILAWTGLLRYNFEEDAQRLAYRWIYMVTKAFVDFNGVVVEKYDVTSQVDPHRVTAEYGNQGSDFKGVATEGFGWVNASYVYGLQIVNAHMKRALGAITDWDTFKKMTSGEYALEDHGHVEKPATKPLHPAAQPNAQLNGTKSLVDGHAKVNPLLDAHQGPADPSSPHTSGWESHLAHAEAGGTPLQVHGFAEAVTPSKKPTTPAPGPLHAVEVTERVVSAHLQSDHLAPANLTAALKTASPAAAVSSSIQTPQHPTSNPLPVLPSTSTSQHPTSIAMPTPSAVASTSTSASSSNSTSPSTSAPPSPPLPTSASDTLHSAFQHPGPSTPHPHARSHHRQGSELGSSGSGATTPSGASKIKDAVKKYEGFSAQEKRENEF